MSEQIEKDFGAFMKNAEQEIYGTNSKSKSSYAGRISETDLEGIKRILEDCADPKPADLEHLGTIIEISYRE